MLGLHKKRHSFRGIDRERQRAHEHGENGHATLSSALEQALPRVRFPGSIGDTVRLQIANASAYQRTTRASGARPVARALPASHEETYDASALRVDGIDRERAGGDGCPTPAQSSWV